MTTMERIHTRLVGAALAASLLTLGTPVAAHAAHPFYERLLQQGSFSLERSDYAAAEEDLRLAAFGFLDEPELLMESLVELAVAQKGDGNQEGLVDTLHRVLEVEDRFEVYDRADLPQDTRHAFEAILVQTLPEPTLAASATFRELALRHAAAELSNLPPRTRRQALDRRLAKTPDEPLWHLLSAELALEQDEPQRAADDAAKALAAEPTSGEGHCLHGRAVAEVALSGGHSTPSGTAARCREAISDLESCDRSRRELPYATPLLGCLVALGDWQQAAHLLDDLPAEVRSDKRISHLARTVAHNHTAAPTPTPKPTTAAHEVATSDEAKPSADPPDTAEGPAAKPTESGPESHPEASAPTPADPAPLPEAARQQLDRARQLLAQARTAPDLTEPLQLAAEVAATHPTSTEAQQLAGQIAYRASRWRDAVRYLTAAGEPDTQQPDLLFYLAVSLYESGETDHASKVLKEALPALRHTPFVDSYIQKILGNSGE